jgi:hypothetical protein
LSIIVLFRKAPLLFIFFTPQKKKKRKAWPKKKRKRLGVVFRIRLTYIVPALLPLVAQSGGIGFFVNPAKIKTLKFAF